MVKNTVYLERSIRELEFILRTTQNADQIIRIQGKNCKISDRSRKYQIKHLTPSRQDNTWWDFSFLHYLNCNEYFF
jgi:hypothetical protein